MKKLPVLLTALAMLCGTTGLFAQYVSDDGVYHSKEQRDALERTKESGWTFRAGLGYSVATAGATFDGTGYPFNGTYTPLDTMNNYKYNVKNASFGAGLKAVLSAEHTFNRNFGVFLGATIGLSGKKYTGSATNLSISGVPSDYTTIINSKMPLFLTPGVLLQTGGKQVNMYMRMAVVLPILSGEQEEVNLTTLPGYGAVTTTDHTTKGKTDFTVGFSGCVGADFNLAEHVSLFVEANVTALSLMLKEEDLKSYTQDGTNYISYFSAADKKTIYSKQANTTNGEQVSYAVPYSSAGINVGIAFKL